jgi:hypothetical protein
MRAFEMLGRRDKVLSQERLWAGGGSPKPFTPGWRFRDVARLKSELLLIHLLSWEKFEAPSEQRNDDKQNSQAETYETKSTTERTICGQSTARKSVLLLLSLDAIYSF